MFDIIGDIHGYADKAKGLLRQMGYREVRGAFRHPDRKALFLGDLIDRGPQQVETVDLVRRMVEAGTAEVILGNHEYNAIAYMTPDEEKPGQFLRKHTRKNRHQHAAFLDQVGEGSDLHHEFINWFEDLPVFIENEDFRAIHACWHGEYIEAVRPLLHADNRLNLDYMKAMNTKGTWEYNAIETLLKGMELDLPNGISYHDKDGVERFKTRTRWWDHEALTYRALGLVPASVSEQLPDLEVEQALRVTYDQQKIVFIGHYWMNGQPGILSDQIACLDYSIGKGTPSGKLCAYRWKGERSLNNDNFSWVEGGHPTNRHEQSGLEP